jgi:hypothetical protein
MMAAMWWTIFGLVASLCGVLLLFRYGMPYRARTGGVILIAAEQEDQDAIRTEALFDKLGWLGIILVTLGTVAQIGGAALSAH